jgi:Na+:H+ antiporter, NhaA family
MSPLLWACARSKNLFLIASKARVFVLNLCAWAAIRLGLAEFPARANWTHLYRVALICGIGFTMSLFIGMLAFPTSRELQDTVKIGVLARSLASALIGAVLLRASPAHYQRRRVR